jgi:hypothetical protein
MEWKIAVCNFFRWAVMGCWGLGFLCGFNFMLGLLEDPEKKMGDMDTCVIGVFVGFTPFVYIVAMSAKQMINKCWL